MTNEIVERNLEKMIGRNQGDMEYALKDRPESMACNANFWEGFPCIAANFHYDSTNGEIKFFGNYNHIFTPGKIRAEQWKGKSSEGTFQMAIDLRNKSSRKDGKLKIEHTGTGKKRIIYIRIHSDVSNEAKQNLEETVRVYNERYGFEVEE